MLAGEDREGRQAKALRALDLSVPIGTFHQPHHDLAVKFGGEVAQPVDHRTGPAAIGLHHDTETVPTPEARVAEHGFDDFQGQGKTVGLLGINVQAKARRTRQTGQSADPWHQFVHHLGAFSDFIARVQGGEFDRNPGVGANVARGGRPGDCGDRTGIGQVVTVGVGFGAGGLTQHVIAVGVALRLGIAGTAHRGFDGFAQDESPAHFLHRTADGSADHRLAQPAHRGAQVARNTRFAVVEHPAGQHQRPGRGVDQAGSGATQMTAPIGGGDLILDQRVHRRGVGHPQKRFGEAHQGDAFVGRKTVFGKEHLHQTGPGRAANGADQCGSTGADGGAGLGVKAHGGKVLRDQTGLVGQCPVLDDVP